MWCTVVHGDGTKKERGLDRGGRKGGAEERESLWKVNLFWQVLLLTGLEALSPSDIKITANLF